LGPSHCQKERVGQIRTIRGPNSPRFSVLVPASGVVRTDAAARRQDDYVLGSEVAADVADVDSLHNHGLAAGGARRWPSHLKAAAAVSAGENNSEAIGRVIANSEGLIVVAQEGCAALLTARLGIQGVARRDIAVIDVADS